MNAPVSLQQIELARLTALTLRTAQDLVDLSDERDTVSVLDGNQLSITYVGRGLEYINLQLQGNYSIETRIRYMTDNLARLTKIKNYILEEMAA